ncbi:MAG: putative Ig domain-containing protein [Arcobacteraceae bacterium]|nr:putative Ig domain-containing protein [Arcobacteraceae bacterium]
MLNRFIDNLEYSSRFRILKGGKISLVVSALLLGSVLNAAPSNGVYFFTDATPNIDGHSYTTSDNFFKISAVNGEVGDASDDSVSADGGAAYIVGSGGIVHTNFTSYIEIAPSITGSFILNSASLGEYNNNVMDDLNGSINKFSNIYVVGYANGLELARTTPISSVAALDENYAIDFTPFSNKLIDTIRVYFDVSSGDIQDRFNLYSIDISGATIDSVNLAPTITSIPITEVNESSAYSYTLTGSDVEGDVLTWSVSSDTNLPSWLHLNSETLVSTLAGSGTAGSTDGNGTSATFNFPNGVAIDSSGNIFVAEYLNHKIRKITPEGVVTTVAGSGTQGSTDGNATTASFNSPSGVAIDSSGNIFVADTKNNKIRKITLDGVVSTFAGSGNFDFADATGTSASLNSPSGIAIDSSGNIFVADAGNDRIRKITPDGVVSTFAGSGTRGSTDGNATTASFHSPSGVAIDSNGNIFVADAGNDRIRKITPDGVVSTFAGSGTATFADGTGTSASFNTPTGVAVDSSGNIFVVDSSNHKIRKITPDGVVTTVAGNGTQGSTNGTGTSASFKYPYGVAIDSSGNILVTDASNNKIRKIISATKLTGTPANSDIGVYDINLTLSDGENNASHNFQITVANINYTPTNIALSSGTLAENSSIGSTIGDLNTTDADLSFDTNETHSYSFCGGLNDGNFTIDSTTLKSNYSFDYETTTSQSVCIKTTDSANATYNKNLTISITNVNETPTITSTALTTVDENSSYSYTLNGSDSDGDTLTWSVHNGSTLPSWLSFGSDPSIVTVSTIAGSGIGTFADDTGTSASFKLPNGVAIDSSGNIFVADSSNNRIRKITPHGVVTTVAGSASGTFGGFADGNETSARFKKPSGIAIDSNGNIFVADTTNNRIRKITPDGVVSTFAGSGTATFADGTGTSASFKNPNGVAIDSSGNIFVADYGNNKIRKITPQGVVTTVAGSGTATFADGTGTTASFKNPNGVAIDSSGNIFVADTGNNKIRKITPDGVVSTFAGSGTATFADGTGTTASFKNPNGVAIDSSGNIFVADTGNNKIRKITPDGVVSTFAGSGTATFADGTGTSASFSSPNGVAIDSSGNIFVADSSNNKIRKITNATILSGTPTNDDVGVHDVNLTLSDGVNEVAHNFQITVNSLNSAPTAITLSSYTVRENDINTTVATLSAIDADISDTHTFSFKSIDEVTDNNLFTIDGTSFKLKNPANFESKSSYKVSLKVVDALGASFNDIVTINVIDVNESIASVCGTANSTFVTAKPTLNLCGTSNVSGTVTFDGTHYNWNCNGATVGVHTVQPVSCNATLQTYTVTIVDDTNSTHTITSGDTYTTEPTKEGYIFSGWYTNANLTTQFNPVLCSKVTHSKIPKIKHSII